MAKGREAERDVKDLFESLGHQVYQPPKAKYREQDVFGLYDLLAFGHGQLRAIQVKAGRDAAGIQDWFGHARTHEEHLADWTVLFVHVVEDSVRVAATAPDGYQWVYDGRADGRADSKALEEVLLS